MVDTALAEITLQGEQRVIIRDLDWQSYLQILSALPESRSARLTYDQGTLEITMPLEDHESFAEWIGVFIRVLVEEMDLELKSIQSTTLNYPGLDKGAEADKAFYIQNQSIVAGRLIDLSQDPPPDLVVEVDITHTDIDQNRLYASMGVPEFWRYNGKALKIYQLQNGAYVLLDRSPTFPQVPIDQLYDFLRDCSLGEVQASKSLRNWLRQIL
jgi:Uma2 family endonuclease